MAYNPKAVDAATTINSFKDFTDTSVPVKSVGMPTGTNLMVRDSNGIDSIVEYGSHWHMGFINYLDGGGAEVVGYAENGNRNSLDPNRIGQMYGRYLSIIEDGTSPDDVWTVHDKNGDGIGSANNGVWTLGG